MQILNPDFKNLKQARHFQLIADEFIATLARTIDEGIEEMFFPGSKAKRENEQLKAKLAAPIPMLLSCPSCHEPHIDEGEWATKPHKTHLCLHCKTEWKPAAVATVGVHSIQGAEA